MNLVVDLKFHCLNSRVLSRLVITMKKECEKKKFTMKQFYVSMFLKKVNTICVNQFNTILGFLVLLYPTLPKLGFVEPPIYRRG